MKLLLSNLLNLTKIHKQLNNLKVYCFFQQQNYCIALNKHEDNQFAKMAKQEIKEQLSAQQKTLSIAVIGVPNAGKSTFINNLINHRVSTYVYKLNLALCKIF